MLPIMKLRRLLLLLISCTASRALAADPPSPPLNIVWILAEDMSPHFSCYGEKSIHTPNVDALAAQGTRFSRAFVTGPICSISRSALITGCYQTSMGCQNHRSSSAKLPITLPEGIRPVPQLLKEAGYHTCNITFDDFIHTGGTVKTAKTDYNFVWDPAATYSSMNWAERQAGQSFFVQIQLNGGKYRGQAPGPAWPEKVRATLGSTTSPAEVTLPPYLPDDETIRADWAQYLDTVRYTDWEVGRIVQRLRDAGELDRTILIFWTDHGISHVRNKQFLYDGGIHVPLIVRGPGIPAGRVRDDLVEHIDITAATLALAHLPLPTRLQGRDFLAAYPTPREFIFAARDRADETVDRIRCVRSAGFKYIRNFYPTRPYLQPNRYKDEKAIVQAMRRLHAAGKLNADQALIMAATRPREELYDLTADPFELHNLAADPTHTTTLTRHRQALDDWMLRFDDHGRTPEPEEIYLNYLSDERPEGGRNARNEILENNIQLMLRWTREKPMQP